MRIYTKLFYMLKCALVKFLPRINMLDCKVSSVKYIFFCLDPETRNFFPCKVLKIKFLKILCKLSFRIFSCTIPLEFLVAPILAFAVLNKISRKQKRCPKYLQTANIQTKLLTLKAPNKNCSRRHFILFTFIFQENKACLAERSHEMSSLIFSEKQ